MNRFLLFNCVGQTGGSFFMDCLQHSGIPCIDEYFNPRGFRPGAFTDDVFGKGKCIEPKDKTSLYDAFKNIESIAPESAKWVGVKVCSSQRHSIHDFREVLNDPDILKILQYRNSVAYYLTKYFHPTWLQMRNGQNPEHRFTQDSFFHYTIYKAEGMKNFIDIESEDIFDFRTNSIDRLSDVLNIDVNTLKHYAISRVLPAQKKTIGELGEEFNFTKKDWNEMNERFQLVQYEVCRNDKFRDCRKININLGFL